MHRSLKPGLQPARETKDREKMMQNKLAELNSQLQRLEKCMAMMRAENEVLRKKQSDQRLLQQKVRILKKRNANLAALNRRLEERVRLLQDRDSRSGQKAKYVPHEPPQPISRRRIQTRQASNPQTTYRRAAVVREHDMGSLHRPKRTGLLHGADARMPQKGRQFEENQELVHIIKVAAKERLQLEHELAHTRMKIEAQLTEHDMDGVSVSVAASITTHSPQCQQRLTRLLAENHQFQRTNSCLRKQAAARATSPEECTALKLSLIAAQKEKEEAEKEAKYLSRRVHSLENVVRDLQDSAEHVSQLENQRKMALQQLQEKQAQLQQLKQVTSSVESSHTHELSSLSQQLAEAAEKLRLEEESRLKLIQEVQRLQKEAAERQRIAAELEQAKQELARLHHEIITEPGEEKSTEMSLLEVSTTSWNHQDQPSDDSLMSQWARNGPIQVYVAKYNYDPFQLSPNENPEAELVLSAGDYVLVVGDMDEDGFYDGELIDGSQGLVPSNYIEKVKDEDLCLFHEVLLHAGHWSHVLSADSQLNNNNNNNNNKTVHTVTAESSPVTHSGISNHLHVASSDRSYVTADTHNHTEYRHPRKLTADTEDENGNSQGLSDSSSLPPGHGDRLGDYTPCPRNLWLDQQLPNSVHISWMAPEPSPGLQVHCYHVLVDGETRAVVGDSDRTKVVLEGISASSTCQVCVRCLSNQGQSRDAQCTMLVGKDAYPVPKDLKLLHLSSTSAVLTWLPGNSNYQHSVGVNGQEVAVVRPGVFYHMLSELQPGTQYQVTVMARSASGVVSKITSPSWLQQVSTSLQFSTPATVNTDQTVGTEARLHSPPLLREDGEGGATDSARQPVSQPVGSPDGEEQKGLETDEEIEEAFRLVEDLDQAVDGLSESSYTNSSRTELSDIPEVEEDLLGSQDSQLNRAGVVQVAFRSPGWTPDRPDRPAMGEVDDLPREFHAEKPVQFDGKPLAAPTPRTPTMAMQNPVTQQLVPAGGEEHDLASTDVICDQPAGDVHISRAFLTMDQTQQKNILNQLHLISVGGHECIGPQDPTYQTPPGFTDPAKLFSENSRLDLVQETPPHELTEGDKHPGSHMTTLPTSFFGPPESCDESGEISGNVSPVVKANSVRLFMALYDYHPETMSPNVDSIDEELSFREGQILKVFGHKDADGFYKGESNGIRGYIPCNLVCEVQVDDPKLRQQLLQDIADIAGEPQAVPSQQPSPDAPVITNGISSNSNNVPTRKSLGRKMVAIYDYDPQELSPNMDAELELSLRTGDVVTIYGDMDEDGFFTGEVNNRCGLVPSNYLQPAPSINYRHST